MNLIYPTSLLGVIFGAGLAPLWKESVEAGKKTAFFLEKKKQLMEEIALPEEETLKKNIDSINGFAKDMKICKPDCF